MNRYISILFCIAFICLFSVVRAQDTIWLLNGEKMVLQKYKLDTERKILTYEGKRGKAKEIETDYIFSIIKSNGDEEVIFTPAQIDFTPFSVPQMRSFVTGEYEAGKNYHPWLATISGIVVGTGSVFLAKEFLPTEFYAPILPALYSTVIGLTDPSSKRIMKKYPKYASDEYFIMGYKETGKQKRVFNTIKGAGIGLLAAIATSLIYSATR